jgi:ergothioneine biosynthesis protein EgtB
MTATPSQTASAGRSAAQHFAAVRRQTLALTAPLSPEDCMMQSMPEASPAKWHLAHTTWFFETFLLTPHLAGYRPFHPAFAYLFNSYYKQLGGHPVRAQRGLLSRPSLDQVLAYRAHVDEHMERLLAGTAPAIAALAELGLHHEQQHQELIVTDVKHALALNPLRPAYREAPAARTQEAPALRWQEFDEGLYHMGHSGDGFSFDNERPAHTVFLHRFRLASRLVTCGEYLAFMREGGYRTPSLWLSDGWDAVCAQQWQAPLYWEERDGQWLHFTCAGMRPLNESEPAAHLSYYEADAFARWAGARLPTEQEWELAARTVPVEGNFLEDARFHPAPAPEPGALAQLFGDLWEWTASPYAAYPGYRAEAGALGEYNGKFMCSQMVLRGGSCCTPRSHIRASYRNFFPPPARWQFSGVRLAQ